MRKYEIMYIVRPDIEEEAHKALIERFNSVLTDNGAEIEKVKEQAKNALHIQLTIIVMGTMYLLTLQVINQQLMNLIVLRSFQKTLFVI